MRKQRLLVVTMSAALIGIIMSAVGNHIQAAPQNSTAIEASCKSNANKKSWCSEVPLVKPVPQPEQQPVAVEPKQQSVQPPTSKSEPLTQAEQNLKPDSISDLEPNQPDLEPNQPPELKPEINLAPEINLDDEFDFNRFTITEVIALNEQQLSLLSAEDIATLPVEVMFYFNTEQFQYFLVNLTPAAIKGFNANHLAALSIEAMKAFDAQTIAELDVMAVKGFDVEQLFSLNPIVIAGFTTQQWENLAITRESPITIAPVNTETTESAVLPLISEVETSLIESEPVKLDSDTSPAALNTDMIATTANEKIVIATSDTSPAALNTDLIATTVSEEIAIVTADVADATATKSNLNEENPLDSDFSRDVPVTAPREEIATETVSIEQPTATKSVSIESPKVAIVPEGTMNPIYSLDQQILIIPEVQVEVAGEIVSYEAKMAVVDNGDNMILIEAQPIESKAQQGIVISSLSLENGELIIPLMEMVDSLGQITFLQVQLQWIQFNPLIFKVNHIYNTNYLLNHTDVVKEVMN
ncbi:MAG: hypothetical protein HC877_00455 [Thioploca sp.]|nr:hypothetical protein [Thioploca sp.]